MNKKEAIIGNQFRHAGTEQIATLTAITVDSYIFDDSIRVSKIGGSGRWFPYFQNPDSRPPTSADLLMQNFHVTPIDYEAKAIEARKQADAREAYYERLQTDPNVSPTHLKDARNVVLRFQELAEEAEHIHYTMQQLKESE